MHINRQSYEEFFLLYADGELSDTDKKSVEQFVAANPDLAAEFLLIRDTVMQPDETIFFENKELLYRSESDERKIVYMRWFRIAAAAVVILSLSMVGWLFVDNKAREKQPVAVIKKPVEKKNSEIAETNNQKNQDFHEDAIQVTREAVDSGKPEHKILYRKKERLKPKETSVTSEREPALDKSVNVPSIVGSVAATTSIDVPVQPRAMEETEQSVPPKADYAESTFDQENEKGDVIYFANTTISKKNKLRAVLRKATRYLDRVTSLQ